MTVYIIGTILTSIPFGFLVYEFARPWIETVPNDLDI